MNKYDLKDKYKYLEKCFVNVEFNAGEDSPSKLYTYIKIIRVKMNKLIGYINEVKEIKNKHQHSLKAKQKIYQIKYDNKESELTKKFNKMKFNYEMKLNSLMLNNDSVKRGRSVDERVMIAKQFMKDLVIKFENAKDTYSRRKSLINRHLGDLIIDIDTIEERLVYLKNYINYAQERLDALIKTKEDVNSIIRLLEIEIKHLDLKN